MIMSVPLLDYIFSDGANVCAAIDLTHINHNYVKT